MSGAQPHGAQVLTVQQLRTMQDFRHRLEVEELRRARKQTDAERARRKRAKRASAASKRKNR